MPIYEYRCDSCGKTIDAYRTVAERDNCPPCCGPVRKLISRPMLNVDIQPYTTVAADKETGKRQHISSRKQHREFLARNGYEEIGSEEFKPTPKTERTNPIDHDFDIFS